MNHHSYEEYLPMLLGDSLPEYEGYDALVDPRIDLAFAAAAYRFVQQSQFLH